MADSWLNWTVVSLFITLLPSPLDSHFISFIRNPAIVETLFSYSLMPEMKGGLSI